MTAVTHPRLVRADIVTHPGGGVVLTTPRGTALRVQLEHAELCAVLAKCDGRTSLRDVAAGHGRAEELLVLLSRLHREGCLSGVDGSGADERVKDWVRFAAPVIDSGRPGRTTLTVVGTGRVARAALALLGTTAQGPFAGVRTSSDLVNYASDGDTMVLALLDQIDHGALAGIEDRCARAGTRWSYFGFGAERGWFGPHVRPGHGPGFADLCARRLAGAGDPDAVRAVAAGPTTSPSYLPPDHELTWMLAAFLVDVERWLAGAAALGLWHEVELDPVKLSITRRPVLPLPDTPVTAPPGGLAVEPADLLVDPRLGIATSVRIVPHEARVPPALITAQAVGCDISRVRPWRNDPVGGGTSFTSLRDARMAAVGELVERYCGNIVRPDLITRATYAELVGAGEHAVDPDTVVLYSAAQHASAGFPFVPLTRERPITWVRGRNLTRGVPAWLPASLVYINWYNTPWGSGDPPTNGTSYPGVAAGATLDGAVVAGLLEIVERHATMVWWLNRQPLPAVVASPALDALWPAVDHPLRPWLIHLDNEFGIPVLAGVVEDPDRAILTIGFAARPNPTEAALKAWAEALSLQEISADLLRPRSAYHAAITKGRLPDQGLKPWRADRRYLDDFRDDFRDVGTLICQSQVHLDPRAVALVRPWVDVPAGRELSDLPRLAADDLATIRAAVEACGHEIFYADITTSDVAAAGMTVVRTLVPGTIGNFPAAFPLLARGVAADCAVRLGWRDQPLPESELTRIPVPHA